MDHALCGQSISIWRLGCRFVNNNASHLCHIRMTEPPIHVLTELGLPVNQAIIRELLRGPCRQADLVHGLTASQSAVSRHVRRLILAGVVLEDGENLSLSFPDEIAGILVASMGLSTKVAEKQIVSNKEATRAIVEDLKSL